MKSMVKILFTNILLIIVLFSFGQENSGKLTKEQKKAEKTRIKKEKEDKQNADWLLIQEIASSKRFVIEFDNFNDAGEQHMLNGRLNFIAVSDEKVVLQLESHPFFANNGLGGVTIDGTISDYKYTPPKNDKKPVYISFNVSAKQAVKASNINITVFNGGTATLTIGSSPSINGDFLAPEKSQIFKGVNMYN